MVNGIMKLYSTYPSLKKEFYHLDLDTFPKSDYLEFKEVNFKNFESRLFSNLFFAGEILNIDAITGGFNFQNAWTGAFLAAKGITL